MEATGTETEGKLQEIFLRQRVESDRIRFTSADERIEKLKKIRAWIIDNQKLIKQALFKDFKKPEAETDLTEIKPMLTEISHVSGNLKDWMKPVSAKPNIVLVGTRSYVIPEPAGVVLIISPWNFPFNLTVGPLISAIAAGNAVIVKPSEFAPATADLIFKMVDDLFPPEQVKVCTGNQEVAEALLNLPFNHIFFTGSPQIGKVVMRAAAENLSSVTLELGGQNPVIVDDEVDLDDAAIKIAFGKGLNAGQSCLSPNYVLVHSSRYEEFLVKMKEAFTSLYGEPDKLIHNSDYGRIVNNRHFQRVQTLLRDALEKGAKVEFGGQLESAENFIAPTLLSGVQEEMKVMNEEIFGPLLPVVIYHSKEEVISRISQKPTPLAAYIFTASEQNCKLFVDHISAGTIGVNETTLQFIHPELPFGGKNCSGIGKAHGRSGFKAFSHEKAVLRQRQGFTSFKLVYPPYTGRVKNIIKLMIRYF